MKKFICFTGIIIGLFLLFAVSVKPIFAALTFSDTAMSGNGAIGITAGAPSTWDVNGTLSLNTTSNGAITTGTGLLTAGGGVTISSGKNLTISSGTGTITTGLSSGGNTASFALNSTISGDIQTTNFQSINNSLIFNPSSINAGFSTSYVYDTYNYIDVPSSNSLNFASNSLRLVPSYNYVKDESSGSAGEYLIGSWNTAEQAGSGVMHRTYGSWNIGKMSNGTGQYVAGSTNQGELLKGSITSVVGVDAQAFLAGVDGDSASSGNVYGVRSNNFVATGFGGSASATNVYDFYAQNSYPNAGGYPPPYSAGTITNYYGVYIEPHTAGVNNWNLYSAGGQNYFGGNVGIGAATPATTLQLAGTKPTLRIGSGAVAGCLELMDSSGNGVINYITASGGVLSATTTPPSICQ